MMGLLGALWRLAPGRRCRHGGFPRSPVFRPPARQYHWVQTPYRYFPIEPHWLSPGMQFMPLKARAFVVRDWPLAHARSTRDAATRIALGTELVRRTEMQNYFHSPEIVWERFDPLVESIVAVRTDPRHA